MWKQLRLLGVQAKRVRHPSAPRRTRPSGTQAPPTTHERERAISMPERTSASVAARHLACHASANLELAIPNWVPPVEDRTKDNAANRGTAKHKMLEPIMRLPAKEVLGMARYLQYVADLRATRRFNVLVEHSVTATWLDSNPQTTADLVLYTQDEIHILDGKWGKIPVDVHDNAQLKYYAVCYAGLAPRAKGVTVHILQPAIDNFDSVFVDTNELAQFMVEMQEAEQKIQAGSTKFGPSDECKFCPANPHSRSQKGKPLCPEMLQLLYPTYVDEAEMLGLD